MAIYTSRFSNPELRKGCYAAIRIALGRPRWNLGYTLVGELKDLMPFGLMGKYDNDMQGFKREYFARLDRIGVNKILNQFKQFERKGQDIVLLCYEDVRKSANDWCHRIMFSEWWLEKTGEFISELPDPTTPAVPKTPKSASKPVMDDPIQTPQCEQLGLF